MDCRQTREFMSALVDNEIDEQTKQKVEEHIWRCATCRTEFELEKKTKQIIQSKVKLIPVPNELIHTILTQIKSLQNGYPQQEARQSLNPGPKPWLEFSFTLGVAVVILGLAVLFVSIYENKMAQKELIAKEVSGLINHFDSISMGFAKPQIISDDPNYIQSEIISRASFTPIILQIPEFKIVGASVNTPHATFGDAKCVNLIYRKEDKMIFLHQAPMSFAPMHEDIKKRILKGEWIYDTIGDASFVIWGTNDLLCCAVSNLSREELEKILKQSR